MKNPALTAAFGALGLALLLAVLDTGARPPAEPPGPADAPAWTEDVEAGRDHLAPGELATRLLDRPESVLLVDVRPADEFDAFHLPGSHRLDLPTLLGPEGARLLEAHPDRLVVLVSNGMTHPAQAWVELARRGRRNVRILEEGLDGFRARLLTPPSLRGPTTERRAREEAALFAALRARMLAAPPPAAGAGRWATDPPTLEAPTVVSAAWAAARIGSLAVLDAREKAEDYAAGHLPGAVHVPIAATRTTVDGVADELLAPDALAAAAGAWGLDRETPVLLYAGDRLQDATHLALALHSIGHRRLAILEGGVAAWAAAGHPLPTESASPAGRAYVPVPTPVPTVRLADVALASRRGSPRILDVRPKPAFEGEKGQEARGGRIPGSLGRPYTEDVVVQHGATWWRRREDLLAGYRALGLDPREPVVVTCRTGHQASLAWFTLRVLLGYKDVRWYDGSWKEWALHADLPAETGPVARSAGGRPSAP